jgi:hypothetical protein
MGEKEKIAKEVESSCACLEVRYRPLDNEDGSLRESWECKHCGANFIRKRRHIAEIKQAKKDAVIETCDAIEKQLYIYIGKTRVPQNLGFYRNNKQININDILKKLKQAQEKG